MGCPVGMTSYVVGGGELGNSRNVDEGRARRRQSRQKLAAVAENRSAFCGSAEKTVKEKGVGSLGRG